MTHARHAAPGRWRRPATPLTPPSHLADTRTRAADSTAAVADRDSGRTWLRNAMAALGILAAAAAVVSWDAQYVMVRSVKHVPAIAALEAGIPDAGALIFASLGIALALHGRRALRPRTLNLACVGLSLAMNAMAAGRGWRDMAIWVMPAAVYALASDTLIGVVRAWALARMRPGDRSLDGEGITPLAVAGAAALWLLRLVLAPVSTLAGFRTWVLEECPVAPGRRAARLAPPPATPRPGQGEGTVPWKATKTGRFLSLVTERHGPLASIPLDRVASISAALASTADLNPGSARAALRKAVLAARNGGPS